MMVYCTRSCKEIEKLDGLLGPGAQIRGAQYAAFLLHYKVGSRHPKSPTNTIELILF